MARLVDIDVAAVLLRLGIKARKQGRELWACCPFHDERDPSWSINVDPSRPERFGLWRCKGSCPEDENAGSLIGLVQRLLRLDDRKEAWRWIKGHDKGTPVKPLRTEIEILPTPGAFSFPRGVVIAPAEEWVTPARDYLTRERGVTAEQIERWGLGYAVIGKLARRVVFPVRDGSGKLLSYTGRLFAGKGPKYKEANEADGADKGSVFGEEHWPAHGARRVVVVAESALDALAIERAVWLPIGGVYGSELLSGHVARLSTFEEVLVCSDPDRAGDKLWRQLKAQLGRWVKLARVELPEGCDAAQIARTSEGTEELGRIIRATAASVPRPVLDRAFAQDRSR